MRPDTAAPAPDTPRPATPARRRRAANALWAWRGSTRALRDHPGHAAQRVRYERAIRAVLWTLEGHASAAALLRAYFDGARVWHLAAARACRDAEGGRPLSRTLVGEVAFWRRLRALIDDLPRGPE